MRCHLFPFFIILAAISASTSNAEDFDLSLSKAAAVTTTDYIIEQKKFEHKPGTFALIQSLNRLKEEFDARDAELAKEGKHIEVSTKETYYQALANVHELAEISYGRELQSFNKKKGYESISNAMDAAAIAAPVLLASGGAAGGASLVAGAVLGATQLGWRYLTGKFEERDFYQNLAHDQVEAEFSKLQMLQAIKDAYDNCATDAAYCRVVDNIVIQNFNFSLLDKENVHFQMYPEIYGETVKFIQDAQAANRPLNAETVSQFWQDSLLLMRENIRKSVQIAAETAAEQGAKPISNNIYEKRLTLEELQERTKRHKEVRDPIVATVSFATNLLAFNNPQKAAAVNTVAESAIGMWDAVHDFKVSLDNWGNLTELKRYTAGISLAAGISSGVLQIASLFKKNEGDMDAAVLKELGEIRQLINELRREMHERFDRIDRSLNEIMENLIFNFNKIDIDLGIIQSNIGEIQESILQVGLKINRLERYTQKYFAEHSKNTYRDHIDKCLGSKELTGQDMSFDTYVECERFFFRWATGNAMDEIWSGPHDGGFTNQEIDDLVNNYPLAVLINFLSDLPQYYLGLSPLHREILPNPVEWGNGARAYIRLMIEWPEHARAFLSTAQRLKLILQVGERFKEAMLSIDGFRDETGKWQKSSELFATLIERYRQALSDFNAAAMVAEQDAVNKNFRIANSAEFLDPWKEAEEQTTTWQPNYDVQMRNCDDSAIDGWLTRAVPLNLYNYLPAKFNLGHAFDLGRLDMCIASADWLETTCESSPHPIYISCSSMLVVTLHIRSNKVPIYSISSRHGPFPSQRQIGLTVYYRTGQNVLAGHWDNWGCIPYEGWSNICGFHLLSYFNAQTSLNPLPAKDQRLAEIDAGLNRILSDKRSLLYSMNALELTRVSELRERANRLTTLRKLIEYYLVLRRSNDIANSDILRSLFYGAHGEMLPGTEEYLYHYQRSELDKSIIASPTRYNPVSIAEDKLAALEAVVFHNNQDLDEFDLEISYIDPILSKLRAAPILLHETAHWLRNVETAALPSDTNSDQREARLEIFRVKGPKKARVREDFKFTITILNTGGATATIKNAWHLKRLIKPKAISRPKCYKIKADPIIRKRGFPLVIKGGEAKNVKYNGVVGNCEKAIGRSPESYIKIKYQPIIK